MPRILGRLRDLAVHPLSALVMVNGVFFGWHAPPVYGACLDHPVLYDLQMLTLLGASVAFWWPIVIPAGQGKEGLSPLGKLGYILLATIPQTFAGMLLALAHRVPRMLEWQAKGTWPPDEQRWPLFVPAEVRGATLGIIGYGSIGREVARIGKTFAMRVLASKRDLARKSDDGYRLPGTGDPDGSLPDAWFETGRGHGRAEARGSSASGQDASSVQRRRAEARGSSASGLHELLAQSDYVVLAAPLTPESERLIGEEELRAMKPSGVFINVGRGATVDEPALVRALAAKRIAGAALDVFSREPLPADSPLYQLDNVILSPHVSGFIPSYDEKCTDLFVANLKRYLHGEPLLNLVDRQKGY